MKAIRIAGILAGVALALAGGDTARGDRFWAVNSSGDFSDTNNWSSTDGGAPPASAPDSTQPTFFKKSGAPAYTVNFTLGGASSSVTVENNSVALDTNSFEYAIGDTTSTLHNIVVSSTGAGSAALTLSDGTIRVANIPTTATGTTVTNFVFVHAPTGSGSAVFNIDGSTSTLWGGQMQIGRLSTSQGSTNTSQANTQFNVTNGGKANFISDAAVGVISGGRGTITIDGAGSKLSSYSMAVGGNASSSLNITNNGLLSIQSPGTSLNNGGMNNWSLGTVTVDSTGTIEIQGGIAQNPNQVALSPSDIRNRNEFRDAGTIRKIAGSSNIGRFVNQADRVNNQIGKFRPGDTFAGPAVGTATFFNVDFTNQTDSSDLNNLVRAQLYLDIASPTSFDRMLLSDPGNTSVSGVVARLGGTIIFADPVGGISFNAATFMDLIVAENVFDQGYTTNLPTVTADWTYQGLPANAWLSIVPVTGGEALRLTVVPEPACAVAIVAAGALMLGRRRGYRV